MSWVQGFCGPHRSKGGVDVDVADSTDDACFIDPAAPYSNYSEAQYGNRTVNWISGQRAAAVLT